MTREFLTILSASALAFCLSPAAHAQSAQGTMNAQGNSNWNLTQSKDNGNSAKERREASDMVPAHAALENTLDTKNCHIGQQIRAKLGENVQLKNGPKLPNGTMLIGKITQVETQPKNVKLAVRFTQAKLKDGTTVPIRAMVVAIARPSSGMNFGNPSTPARDLWNRNTYQVDQIGAVSGADLHSKINGRNSAVISSDKKNDVKIDAGSRLDMAIAKQQQWHQGNQTNSNPSL